MPTENMRKLGTRENYVSAKHCAQGQK